MFDCKIFKERCGLNSMVQKRWTNEKGSVASRIHRRYKLTLGTRKKEKRKGD